MSENNCTLTQYIVSVVKKKVCYENTNCTLRCNIIFVTYRVHFRQCFRLVNENESFSVTVFVTLIQNVESGPCHHRKYDKNKFNLVKHKFHFRHRRQKHCTI